MKLNGIGQFHNYVLTFYDIFRIIWLVNLVSNSSSNTLDNNVEVNVLRRGDTSKVSKTTDKMNMPAQDYIVCKLTYCRSQTAFYHIRSNVPQCSDE